MKRTRSTELVKLRDRVDAWRQRQGKRTRIPQELWDAAVEVAKREGVWAASQAARFNYEKLRQLTQASGNPHTGSPRQEVAVVEERRVGNEVRGTEGSVFVDLGVGVAPASRGTVIELLGRHGDRMRVEAHGGVDFAAVVQAFWRGQPCCN